MTDVLAGIPRIDLGYTPTPLEPLDRLSEMLGGPRIWIKRDDCTGLATGGNKTRKLEYLMADALAQRADTVITFGAVQSNHARQTAAACAKLGSRVSSDTDSSSRVEASRNTRRAGMCCSIDCWARMCTSRDRRCRSGLARELIDDLASRGSVATWCRPAVRTAIGALGYVRCAAEILGPKPLRSVFNLS